MVKDKAPAACPQPLVGLWNTDSADVTDLHRYFRTIAPEALVVWGEIFEKK